MSLYGRVDSTANQTAVGLTRGNGAGSATETIVFVDETEAGLASNKTRVLLLLVGGHIAHILMLQVTLAIRQST